MNKPTKGRRNFLIQTLGNGTAIAAGSTILGAAWANVNAYPTKPIRLIVPFSAGSATDIMTRILVQHIAGTLKQEFVVDNRVGAAGAVGADMARRATPDGYTLVMDAASSHSTLAALRPKSLPYNILTDFTSIGRACTSANMIAVNNDLPVKNLKELIAYSRQLPKGLSYAAGGSGASNHLAGQILNLHGANLVHVPYTNLGQAVIDTISGTVPMLIYTVSLLPFIRQGRIRGIATLSDKRATQAPELPTAVEQGVPVIANSWFGLFGPAKLPLPIRDVLYEALRDAMTDTDVRRKLLDAGLAPALLNPAETDAFVVRDIAMWKDVVERAKIPLLD